jgi:2-dehydropantoate 2-reductase
MALVISALVAAMATQLTPVVSASKSPWWVLGRGAIGLLAASRWTLAGQPVRLWLKQPQMTSFGYTFSAQDGDIPLQLDCSRQRPVELVLLPLKAFDILPALEQLLAVLSQTAQIVLCHNGMGTIDAARTLLSPGQGLWFASTTHGAFKPNPQQICHSGVGNTVLGPCNTAARHSKEPIAAMLDQALGPVRQVEDIERFLWRKLAVNTVINPLTALHQCRNGALGAAAFSQQITQLLTEFAQLAAAAGQPLPLPELQSLVSQVIEQTAANYSSMQQDVAASRRTELAAISGFVLQQASQLQLSLPAHQALYQQLTSRLAPWQYQ